MKHPHVTIANRYAREVVSGKIPAGLYVIQACKRHLDDLKKKRFPYKFDLDKAELICVFAELMPHVKGKWAGSTIRLEPWQCFFLAIPFGWISKTSGARRFREVYAEIPRKNTKSTLGAIIGNYMFTADGEPGAEVYSGATALSQAYEVFRPAWLMSKKLPEYEAQFSIERGGTDKNPGNLYSTLSENRFEPVIGKPGDGASVHCGIVDEYHEHATDHVYDCFATGMGSREQPLLVVITTAGTNTASPCYHKRGQAIRVLSKEVEDEQLFSLIFTIDKEDDWTDFDVWKKANPNFGVSVFEDYLKRQHQTAIRDARKQNILKCKHLNVWSNAGESFFNMVDFEKCADSLLDINDFYGEPVYIGLDLASKIDLAALIAIFKKGNDFYMFSRYYLPESRTLGEEFAHYAGWAHEGYIQTTPGNRIDYEVIEADIKGYAKDFDLTGPDNGGGEVCNDPWSAHQLITNLDKAGIAVTEIPQTVSILSEPLKELEKAISEGRLHHDGNPVTYWCFSNVMAREDKNENVFPYKEGKENKIDGAAAALDAFCRAAVEEDTLITINYDLI